MNATDRRSTTVQLGVMGLGVEIGISSRQMDHLVGLARELVRVPTENPPGNYEEILPVLSAAMQDAGLEVRIVRGQHDKPNVVGIWRGSHDGGGPRRALLFSGH
ncbi:MAG: hypothetical protein K6U74_16860, partial [Firmicutes bacterium]|nr:hypothetical protein [Bacillota bacterium]